MAWLKRRHKIYCEISLFNDAHIRIFYDICIFTKKLYLFDSALRWSKNFITPQCLPSLLRQCLISRSFKARWLKVHSSQSSAVKNEPRNEAFARFPLLYTRALPVASLAHSPSVLWRMSWDLFAWALPPVTPMAVSLLTRTRFACNKWKQRCTLTLGKGTVWIINLYVFYGRKWQGNCGRRWLKSGCHGRRSHLFEIFCFPFKSFWFYALPLSGRVCLYAAWNKRKNPKLIYKPKVNLYSSLTGLILVADLFRQWYIKEHPLWDKNEEF